MSSVSILMCASMFVAANAEPTLAPSACTSARASAALLIETLSQTPPDFDGARRCVASPSSMNSEDVHAALIGLKRVLDARGIAVSLEALPLDPNYQHPLHGGHEVALTTAIPSIVFVKSNGQWLLSQGSVETAVKLAHDAFLLDIAQWTAKLPAWAHRRIVGVSLWQFAALFALVFIAFLISRAIEIIFVGQLKLLSKRWRFDFGETVLHHAASPAAVGFASLVVFIIVPELRLPVRLAEGTLFLVRMFLIGSIVTLAYRSTSLAGSYFTARALKTESKLDDQIIPLLFRFLKLVVILLGVVFFLQSIHVDVGGLVAGLGLGGLAIALAAKDVVANFLGSLTIFFDRPFHVGDSVITSGVEGVVEEVGIRSTRIRTFSHSLVTIPNGKFIDAVVDNMGMRTYRRCSIKLALTYDTTPEKIETFCQQVRSVITAHKDTRKEGIEVYFNEYAESSLNVLVYFYFHVDAWTKELKARHEIFLEVWRVAETLGVSFAFPTQTQHVRSDVAADGMTTTA